MMESLKRVNLDDFRTIIRIGTVEHIVHIKDHKIAHLAKEVKVGYKYHWEPVTVTPELENIIKTEIEKWK